MDSTQQQKSAKTRNGKNHPKQQATKISHKTKQKNMQVSIPDIKIQGVTKHTMIDVQILFCTVASLSGKLLIIPSTLENIAGHGHKHLIMSKDNYKKLNNVNTAVKIPAHPGAFTAIYAA